jgi:hypothetical protein
MLIHIMQVGDFFSSSFSFLSRPILISSNFPGSLDFSDQISEAKDGLPEANNGLPVVIHFQSLFQ